MFRVHLFGEFQLHDARGQTLRLTTRKTQWLLAYLLLNPEPQTREHLADLFWPDSEPIKASTSLRQALRAVRSALELEEVSQGTPLRTDRGIVQFNVHSAHWIDASEFRKLCKESEKLSGDEQARCLREAIALYRGDLLEGCYDDWCLEARDYFRELYLKVLQQIIFYHKERKEFSLAIGYAKQLLVKSPLQEETHRELMYLFYAMGDRNAALQQFRECERILKTELNIEPLPETRALYHEIEKRASPDRLKELVIQSRELIRRYPELGAPFVGRSDEWQRLTTAWDEVQQKKGRAVVFAGEAGVGKSRLAQEFLDYAEKQESLVFSGRCYKVEEKLPYQALIEALRDGLAQVSEESLKNISALWLGEVVKLLPELAEKISDLRPSVELTSREQERNRLFEGLHQFLSGLSQQSPVVIHLDDLQWADESTLEFVHYLIRRLPEKRILLVGAYRVEEVENVPMLWGMLQQLTRDQLIAQISLMPLKSEEIEELVQGMLETEELGELWPWVYEQSKGVPFFAVELIKSFLEAGALSLDERGHWRVEGARLSPEYIPSTVRALVETRLRRVSPPSRQVLDIAAVTGRAFTTELLMQIMERQPEDMFDRIEELLRAHLIIEEQEKYYFRHDMIREVVYGGLQPVQRRKSLHRSVGEALERAHAQRLDAIAGELAYHFLEAMVWEKALDFSIIAGQHSKRAYANNEAVRYFEKALELIERYPEFGTVGRLLQIHEELGDIQFFAAQWGKAMEHFEKALTLTQQSKEIARLCIKLARVLSSLKEIERSREQLVKAQAALGSKYEGIEAAQILWTYGYLHFVKYEWDQALNYINQGLAIAHRLQDISELPIIYGFLTRIYFYKGELGNSIHWLDKALKLAEDTGDFKRAAHIYSFLADCYRLKGSLDIAKEYAEKGIKIAEKIGANLIISFLKNRLGEIFLDKACWEMAEAVLQDGKKMAEELGFHEEVMIFHCNLGFAYTELERLNEAMDHFNKAILIGRTEHSPHLSRVFCGIAITQAKQAKFKEALESAELGFSSIRLGHSAQDSGIALRVLGMAYYQIGQFDRSIEFLEKGIAHLKKFENLPELGRVYYMLGLAYANKVHSIDKRPSLEYFDKSLEIFKRIGAFAQADKVLLEYRGFER